MGTVIDDLDTSWIEKEEKINSTGETIYVREPLNEIKLFFIYINNENAIEQITKDYEPVLNTESGSGGITKERLLQIIQTKKNGLYGSSVKKYKLMDILSFQLDIESEDLDDFLSTDFDEISRQYLKVLPIFDGIECPESIFIFHDINSLYFLFKENEVVGGGGGIRSILKSNSSSSEKRATKKVRILMEGEPVLENKRKSSKRNLKLGKYTRKVLQ
jgi:hypothetical protein